MKLRVLSFLFFDVAEKKGGRERETGVGLGWVGLRSFLTVFMGVTALEGVLGLDCDVLTSLSIAP